MSPTSASVEQGRHSIWLAAVATLILAADQLTKAWAVTALDDQIIPVVWTLRLRLAYNTGFAFSAGQGLGPVLAVAALVIVGVLWVFRSRVRGLWPAVCLGAIIGGALGNLSDRVLRDDRWGSGAVVDFVDLQWWPIFNVADAAITVGVAGLMLYLYRTERQARSAVPPGQ